MFRRLRCSEFDMFVVIIHISQLLKKSRRRDEALVAPTLVAQGNGAQQGGLSTLCLLLDPTFEDT